MQVGPQDYVRLTSNSMVTVVAQEPGLLQFRVGSGTASFDLRSVQAGQMVEIDTPNGALVVGRTGYYRVDIRGNATHVTVRRGGQATLVLDGNRNHSVSANEELVVIGGEGGGRPTVERRAAAQPDSWDRWNDARSDYYANAASQRYVPAGVYGVADLDQHGSWRDVETYGPVWVPAVAAGWAPYSTGSWQWDPVFGWTWVDQAPWGWATSHYGRWVFVDGFWGWAPGPRVARPVYAPALVAFFQAGTGISWVALGWGEPLIPWWGRPGFRGAAWWGGWGGPRIINNRVHHRGAVDVGVIRFRHTSLPNAVISARHEEFGRERFHGSRLPAPQTRDLAPIRGVHPVRPMHGVGPVGDARPASGAPVFRDRAGAPGSSASPAVSTPQPGVSRMPSASTTVTVPAAALPRQEAVPASGQMRQRHERPTEVQERQFGRREGIDRAPLPSGPVAPAVPVAPTVPAAQTAPVVPAPVIPQVAPQAVPQVAPAPRQEPPPPRWEMHQRRERGPDGMPGSSVAPIPAPLPSPTPPPAVQRPQPMPAPIVAPVAPAAPMAPAPAPVMQRPQPVQIPAAQPAPTAPAPTMQRPPPAVAPMPSMAPPSMPAGDPRVFRERERERRHEERPRHEMRGEPQQSQPQLSPQGRPGEPPGRMFQRQRD
jgi:hypothetical protein